MGMPHVISMENGNISAAPYEMLFKDRIQIY